MFGSLWVDDDVSAASTYDTEVPAIVPGYELPGKLLLTGYTIVGFSFLPFDLCYPSYRFLNCDPITCLSCSLYSYIPTTHNPLHVYLLAFASRSACLGLVERVVPLSLSLMLSMIFCSTIINRCLILGSIIKR